MINKAVCGALCLCVAATANAAQLAFSGNQLPPVTVSPDALSGLNDIFVLSNTDGVTASYPASAAAKVLRFSNLGGGYAEEIPSSTAGANVTFTIGSDDMGFIVEDGTNRYYCWVVNYNLHRASLQGLSPDAEQDCGRTRLHLVGNADPITYFSINGAARTLSRELKITYNSLEFNEESEDYTQVTIENTLPSAEGTIGVTAPLCDTYFNISGDRFLEAWGMGQHAESDLFHATAVEAHTSAEQVVRENDNEQKIEAATLGGSAPVDVTFTAVVTDAAIFREWQMSTDPEFEQIDDRFQQTEFSYTFTQTGTTYVRFIANNAAGTCEYAGETYDVFVGDSNLLCPNVFSPNDDGVNDVWKVSYKSIVEFECSIFNRWGQKMCSFNDPAEGWDGKYGGRTVPAGTYYYVIRAKGSDGRSYNLSGDINIISKKLNQNIVNEDTE